MTYGKRPPLDEEKALFESQVAREGTTTGPGAVAGNSLIDAGLKGFGANSFFTMLAVVHPGNAQLVDSFDITAFDDVTGEVTLNHNYKGGRIPAGVPYKIVTFRFVPTEVAALTALVQALMLDVGDASTAVLGSLFGILGDPAAGQDLATRIGYEGALSLANKLTAARALLLDEITALRMAELDPANLPADIAAVAAQLVAVFIDTAALLVDTAAILVDTTAIEAAIGAIEGATSLHNKLTVARALLLDEITAARMEELDGANIPADIDTLLTRITEAVATAAALTAHNTALGTHDTDIKAVLTTIAGYIDDEITAIITSQGRQLDRMVKWSAGKVQVQIDDAGATVGLPTITIENLPDGATIVEAHLMFKFRMIENKYAGVNKLQDATVALTSQVIQIQDDGGGDWADGINFVDDFFTLASEVREGGDVIIGEPNVGVASVVDGNDTYNVRLLLGKADFDFINFDDCQVGLDILYSV